MQTTKRHQNNKKSIDNAVLIAYNSHRNNKILLQNKRFYRKEVAFMSEREKQIIKTFALILPKLSESDKSYLLGLGEGMAIKVDAEKQKEKAAG